MIKLNDVVIEAKRYPDGTPLLRVADNGYSANKITWAFDDIEELVTLSFITQHLRDKTNGNISLFLPYIPNARMDRVKSGDEVFTLRYFADMINRLHFKDVLVLDPHSSVATALINHVCPLSCERFINEAYVDVSGKAGEVPFFVYPDEGAMKRYSSGGLEYVFGIKRRDWRTGKIKSLDIIGDIPTDRPALIVDDICSRGGTFVHTAKALREHGVKNIGLYVTHCENTIFEGDLLTGGYIDHVYTTDSILRKTDPKITIFKTEDLLR